VTTRDEALAWYEDAYKSESYGMGAARKQWAQQMLRDVPRGTLFDVGCGRGEMIAYANQVGFDAQGCETVPDLIGGPVVHGLAHELPCGDDAFDVVTMFDVMEHLTESDCMAAIDELQRVARKHILLSISNRPSIVKGIDIHITKKPYSQWDRILRDKIPGTVRWFTNTKVHICDMWRIDL
jgi:ubiquinone/menaquinone biosynthesis C-methylase UbiE